ncbi:DUF1345 domain-containing protein [Muricoccus radiodurans]|uniref:DUF1345 domain-containing protein n=1 Tax=Muricoccus radiodurans TaxID=2231721 RepID=UPI003CF9EADD
MWLSLRRRPTILAALAIGLLVGIGTGLTRLDASTAILLGWDAAVVAYLLPVLWLLWPATPESMAQRAAELDEDKWTILGLAVAAALASIIAVVVDLAAAKGTQGAGLAAALAGITVVLSWIFVQILFAHHYAHEFWLDGKGQGLEFPGNDRPDFPEFLYLSLTIGMTAQVSDVTTCSAGMRRLVMGHAALSFLFNAVVVAAAVNLAAALVG